MPQFTTSQLTALLVIMERTIESYGNHASDEDYAILGKLHQMRNTSIDTKVEELV